VNEPQSGFKVAVDMTNPGQVIACCGLLELAQRVWPGAEGWFQESQFTIALAEKSNADAIDYLVNALRSCEISGLSQEEGDERKVLEKESKELKKNHSKLTPDKEKRRKELGESARAGVIRIGEPFDLMLDWWDALSDEATPKTWAGRQELHRIVRAAQDALSDIGEPMSATLLDFRCVLREPKEYRKGTQDHAAVEPFYFDAGRLAHRLDVGFSLDTLGFETAARPSVELLCLIGLQRFRPAPNSEKKWDYDYYIWSKPLNAPVAAAVFSGVAPLPGWQKYHFHLLPRDDQKRYKAFGPASLVGNKS